MTLAQILALAVEREATRNQYNHRIFVRLPAKRWGLLWVYFATAGEAREAMAIARGQGCGSGVEYKRVDQNW